MKMLLHERLVLEQLRHDIDKGYGQTTLKLKKACEMECCQKENYNYHKLGKTGMVPIDIAELITSLTVPGTCAIAVEIYFTSRFTDMFPIDLSDVYGSVIRFYKRQDGYRRYIKYGLDVKKITIYSLAKNEDYGILVIPHKITINVSD